MIRIETRMGTTYCETVEEAARWLHAKSVPGEADVGPEGAAAVSVGWAPPDDSEDGQGETEEQIIARISEAVAWGLTHEICACCGATVLRTTNVAGIVDDNTWERIERAHGKGCEWVATRAHRLRGACECGTITGVPCAGPAAPAETVRVRWVPPYQRGTAEAAGTWRGVSERLTLDAQCWRALLQGTDADEARWYEVV